MKTISSIIGVILLFSSPLSALADYSTDLDSGSNQYWSIADGSQTGLDVTSSLTLALWVKTSQTSDGRGLVVKGHFDAATDVAYGIQIGANTNGKVRGITSNGSSFDITDESTNALNDGAWHHVAIVFNPSTSLALYVDGSQDKQLTTSVESSIQNISENFVVGRDTSGRQYDGLIDDVRIWSRQLSGTEISNLKNNPCSFSNGSDLQGWWKFENNGTDDSGNGNTLTNNNSATFTSDTPFTCTAAPTLFFTDFGIFGNGSVGNSTSTAGVFLGKDASNTNQKIEIVAPSTGTGYIDFTKPLSDFLGRISFNNTSGDINFEASRNIILTPASSTVFYNKIGIGTTSPVATFSIQATSSIPFIIGSSTTLFIIDNKGHIGADGYSTTVSSCGTSPSVIGDDTGGTITVGSTTDSCTLNFATSRVATPHCVVSNQNAIANKAFTYTVSATQIVLSQQTLGNSKIDYVCIGK